MTEKEAFKKTWEDLIIGVHELSKITEVNRRLIAGLTVLLADKDFINYKEIKKLETDVIDGMTKEEKEEKK